MTAIRSSVPRHLVAKVPPMLLMSLSLRTFWNIFGVGLGLLLLYGPITGINQDHNGLRYLLGPLIGPTVALSFLLLCPFNPYRGSAARLSGMENRDKWDPEARRLVELFRSNAARRFLVTSSMKISCVLYLFMVPVIYVCWDSLKWHLLSPWLGQGLLGCSIATFTTLGAQYVGWGLKTWGNR